MTQASTNQDRSIDFIELGQIRALPQVRTEFDENSIAELAKSIQAHGMLQPVLLRASDEGGYIVIAGERRIRAALRAGLSHVPALVGQVDDDKANEMQLVENIQREELSLADTAKGVLQLYERNKSQAKVGEILGKSVPWVSKHVAAATNLGWNTRTWFEHPESKADDLELVLTLNQMEKLGKWYPRVESLTQQIDEGHAGRAEARELLQTMRQEIEEERKAKKAESQHALPIGAQAEPEPAPWNAETELHDLYAQLDRQYEAIDQVPTADLIKHLDKAQQAAMTAVVKESFNEGKKMAKKSDREKARELVARYTCGYDDRDWDTVAHFLGIQGDKLTLAGLVVEAREMIRLDH
ncbi:ParB/RepB/Spo0J family partition protein [Variovorax sp. VNK109]|uniref:ParB/RepB/Spo0J family partition protein n=1 Tax=Variovorax sp. VNK109 TaxID=3400919 RepID=UPI003C055865